MGIEIKEKELVEIGDYKLAVRGKRQNVTGIPPKVIERLNLKLGDDITFLLAPSGNFAVIRKKGVKA